MQLTKDQSQALNAILSFDSPTFTLAGPAGTGKTTLIGEYIRKAKGFVHISATTHKAAAVLASKTDRDVSTVHSLFGLRPVQDYSTGRTKLVKKNKPKVEPYSTVVVDEASMIDREMLDLLTKEAHDIDAKLLFVGDAYQLPPVSDDAEAPVVFSETPTIHLKKIVRQAADNPIIGYASQIRQVLDGGKYPAIPKSSEAIRKVDQADFMNAVSELYNSAAYQSNPDYCRVVAWTNKTVIAWNRHIRQMLLGPDARKYAFVPGERMIANKPVVFGDSILVPNEGNITVENAEPGQLYGLHGHFLGIDFDSSVFKRLFVPADHGAMRATGNRMANKARAQEREHGKGSLEAQEAWKAFFDFQDRMCDFRSGYASTVHKSQGSTYQHVLIHGEDISRAKTQAGHMLARLMYVAVTRAAQTATIYAI